MTATTRIAMQDAIEAPRACLSTRAGGMVSYYADTGGRGRPLLLLHSINAAPSALEVLPLFEHFRGTRPVYALELPGFGFSERADRNYNPRLYADVLIDFIGQVLKTPVDAVALSTTSEFLARAALDSPESFSSLVLISPTGLSRRPPPTPATGERLHRFFRLPLLGAGLYRALTTRASIRYFLNLNFTDSAPVELIDYACETSRQPGARHAPYCFLSMKLFTRDAATELYAPLTVPTLVLYDEDPNVSFEKLEDVQASNPRFLAERIAPSQGLPHWEEPEQTVSALAQFWSTLDD